MRTWAEVFGDLRGLLHGPQVREGDRVPHQQWRAEMVALLLEADEDHEALWHVEGIEYASQFHECWETPLVFDPRELGEAFWASIAPFAYIPMIDHDALNHCILGRLVLETTMSGALTGLTFEARWRADKYAMDRPFTGSSDVVTDLQTIWFSDGDEVGVYTTKSARGVTWTAFLGFLEDWEFKRRARLPNDSPRRAWVYCDRIRVLEDGSLDVSWSPSSTGW